MQYASRSGPRRDVVDVYTVKRTGPDSPKYALKLECGHTELRLMLRKVGRRGGGHSPDAVPCTRCARVKP